jgi:NifU-like protein involved in Fe-S cluster formation
MTENLTRLYFEKEDHLFNSGDDKYSYAAKGSATNSQGMEIDLYFKVEEGRIIDAKYNVSGCPVLVAISAFYIENVIGKELNHCRDFNAIGIHESIEIPNHKKDRMILLEDAVYDCLDQIRSR